MFWDQSEIKKLTNYRQHQKIGPFWDLNGLLSSNHSNDLMRLDIFICTTSKKLYLKWSSLATFQIQCGSEYLTPKYRIK